MEGTSVKKVKKELSKIKVRLLDLLSVLKNKQLFSIKEAKEVLMEKILLLI